MHCLTLDLENQKAVIGHTTEPLQLIYKKRIQQTSIMLNLTEQLENFKRE